MTTSWVAGVARCACVVIAQLLLLVVEFCAKFAYVALEASLAMAASEDDRFDARGSSQACAIWTASLPGDAAARAFTS